jgi:hypothetical protein
MTKTVIERLAAIDRQLERLRVAPTGSGSTPGGPVPDTRNMIAGAGLTGGGTLAADRTFTVGAGAGITVNADDVALTTPGTLTMASTNTATGTHTATIQARQRRFWRLAQTGNSYSITGSLRRAHRAKRSLRVALPVVGGGPITALRPTAAPA